MGLGSKLGFRSSGLCSKSTADLGKGILVDSFMAPSAWHLEFESLWVRRNKFCVGVVMHDPNKDTVGEQGKEPGLVTTAIDGSERTVRG